MSAFDFGPDLPRWRDAYPLVDRDDVEECRHGLNADLVARTVEEIEGYDANSAEELGVLRDLAVWGCNPFVED